MEAEARRELARDRATGSTASARRSGSRRSTYLTDAAAALGDAATAALLYPELAPLAGSNVVIGHGVACYGAADRYLGCSPRRSATRRRAERHFEAALALNRRMGAGRGSPTPPTSTGGCCARRRRERARSSSARRRRSPSGSAWPRCAAGSALGRRDPAARHPTACPSARCRSSALVAEGLSNREIGAALFISEHTAANHIRSILRKTGCANRTEAATYATATAWRRPDAVGSRDAAVRDRARFAEDLELTGDDVRRSTSQRRRGRPLAVLVPQRRPPPDLLPLRGPPPEAIRAAAKQANVPADAIVEVGGAASPELVPRMRERAAAQTG